MNFTLDDLTSRRKGTGIDAPPSVDVKSLIDGITDQVAPTPMTPVGR